MCDLRQGDSSDFSDSTATGHRGTETPRLYTNASRQPDSADPFDWPPQALAGQEIAKNKAMDCRRFVFAIVLHRESAC